MVSGSLALLYFSWVFMGGSRAAALIGDKVLQNGEIFCLSVRPFPPLGYPARPEAQPAVPEA